MKLKFMLVFVMLLVFVITGTAFAVSSDGHNETAEARTLFNHHCAMCHGQDAKGNTPIAKKIIIPDLLSPAVQSKSDGELEQIIENGKQKMPAFGSKLKKEQIKDLVGYLRELAKHGGTEQK